MREKLVLVTGATAGIGFHTALGFAAQGARVIITGRNVDKGLRAQAVLRERAGHGRVHFLAVDHQDVEATRELGVRVASEFRRLDVLVNNVGGVPDASYHGAGNQSASPEAHDAVLDLNYLAAFALTDSLVAAMLTNGRGRIINVVPRTYARFRGDPFEPGAGSGNVSSAYARAKLLELLWTLALTRDLAHTGVTVNAFDPGRTWAPARRAASSESAPYSRYVLPFFRFVTGQASVEDAASPLIALGADPAFDDVSGQHFTSSLKARSLDARVLSARSQEDAVGFAVRLIARSVRRPVRDVQPLDLAVA